VRLLVRLLHGPLREKILREQRGRAARRPRAARQHAAKPASVMRGHRARMKNLRGSGGLSATHESQRKVRNAGTDRSNCALSNEITRENTDFVCSSLRSAGWRRGM
jgi:hypothetical protein